jgi:hypothetical protein
MVVLDHLPEARPHMQFTSDCWETVSGTSAGKALHLAQRGVELGYTRLSVRTTRGSGSPGCWAQAGVDVRVRTVPGRSERHLNLMDPNGGRVSVYLSTAAAPTPELVADLRAAELAVLDPAPANLPLIDVAREAGVPVWTDLHD